MNDEFMIILSGLCVFSLLPIGAFAIDTRDGYRSFLDNFLKWAIVPIFIFLWTVVSLCTVVEKDFTTEFEVFVKNDIPYFVECDKVKRVYDYKDIVTTVNEGDYVVKTATLGNSLGIYWSQYSYSTKKGEKAK